MSKRPVPKLGSFREAQKSFLAKRLKKGSAKGVTSVRARYRGKVDESTLGQGHETHHLATVARHAAVSRAQRRNTSLEAH